MRWEDERYVRLYTRDTPEFLALSWHARGLFSLILRKVDRAGVLPLGRLGLKGVAVAIGAPAAEIEPHLAELLEDGCVVFDDSRAVLFMPNFMKAQEAPQSDRARAKASRERAQAEFGGSARAAAAARSIVTKRDPIVSQDVTQSGGGVTERDAAASRREGVQNRIALCAEPSVLSRDTPTRAAAKPTDTTIRSGEPELDEDEQHALRTIAEQPEHKGDDPAFLIGLARAKVASDRGKAREKERERAIGAGPVAVGAIAGEHSIRHEQQHPLKNYRDEKKA
jgi:hypothetical protein